jgi:hypothetical protein
MEKTFTIWIGGRSYFRSLLETVNLNIVEDKGFFTSVYTATGTEEQFHDLVVLQDREDADWQARSI